MSELSSVDACLKEPQADHVKTLMRKRDVSDGYDAANKRQRANTIALLPETPQAQGEQESALIKEEDDKPPKPEDDPAAYDQARLQAGLQYISRAEKRKITPRTETFMYHYKNAYKDALQNTNPDSRASHINLVSTLDKVYQSEAFYFAARLPEDYNQLMVYAQLRRMEFMANYGDWAGIETTEIRNDLSVAAQGSEGAPATHDVLLANASLKGPRSWTNISDELQDTDVPHLMRNVWTACDTLHYDPAHMLEVIQYWADRNRTMHNRAKEFMETGQWDDMKKQLMNDIKELYNIIPVADRHKIPFWEKLLYGLRDRFYDIDSSAPDDTNLWTVNARARQISGINAKKNQNAQKQIEEILRLTREQLLASIEV